MGRVENQGLDSGAAPSTETRRQLEGWGGERKGREDRCPNSPNPWSEDQANLNIDRGQVGDLQPSVLLRGQSR